MTRLSLLSVAIAASLATPLAAFAQTAAPATAATPAAQTDKSDLDKVVVTGTRTSTRTIVTSQSPIDIVSAETLKATGTSELATALSRVLPSLNFPRPALTDGTSAIRPAQLRGLAPDQVLVLVNGKRRHTSSLLNINGSVGRGSAPVDLNTIPMSAIDHVEVLRDGASAQYGSDAIAGVVNVILKGADHGGSLSYSQGRMSAGDGEQIEVAGDAGFKFAGERGSVHLSGQVNRQEHTNRAGPYAGAPSASQAAVGQTAFVFGDPSVRAHAFSINSSFKINDSIELYGWGTTSNRDITSYAFFRAPGSANNVPAVYPLGYVPEINNISKDQSAVLGARGTIGNDWDWDLSYNYGYNHLDFYTRHTLNVGLGTATPHDFYDGALETTQNVVNLDLRKQFNIGTASPLSVAFGAESRHDKWNQSPGEYLSYAAINPNRPGAQGFGGFAPSVSGHYRRNSYAVYADAETDITSKFSADAAVRYEHFSDFGSKTSGKLSARYAFTPNFALRGTVSTGFRAPSLAQQYFQTVSTNFLQGNPVPFEIRTFPATSAVAKAFGAEPLKPETSKSASLGLVTQPLHGLFVTVDAYQVDVKDRIVLSSNLTGNGVRALLESQGIFGVNGGRYFTNAVDTRSRGVDVVGSYRWRTDAGTLDLTAGYNYGSTKITRIAPNPAVLEASGLNLQRIDRTEIGRIEEGFPRNKITLAGLWKAHDWEASLSGTRYGSVTSRVNPPTTTVDQTYAAKWIADASVSYKLGGWKFTVGADNLFNTYPDENYFVNSTSGQFPYSSLSPFGFNGRYVYGKVGFTW
ncbi:MAG: TonB-dependent receptor [Proteobacteria bacterium]|nr:TonB-dependent receptor [Pseudomonadota bacterium]